MPGKLDVVSCICIFEYNNKHLFHDCILIVYMFVTSLSAENVAH